MSVLVVANTDGFGSLGTLRAMFVLGTPPGVTVCDP